MITKLWLFLLIHSVFVNPGIYTQEPESAIVTYEYGTKDQALMDLFRFWELDYYKFDFSGKSFKAKIFEISYMEYRDGQPSEEQVFTESDAMKTLMRINQDPLSFEIKVISQQITQGTVKFLFIFNNKMGKDICFDILNQDPPYSLRTPLRHNHRDDGRTVSGDRIFFEKKIPILVYSLPYEDPQSKGLIKYKYCQLTADGIPPEKWGEHYGVKHYVIFYLTIKDADI